MTKADWFRGWRNLWEGADALALVVLYRTEGGWEALAKDAPARVFRLPAGFSSRLDGLGSKAIFDGFGHEARLITELLVGEFVPVLIDAEGERHALQAA